MSSAAAKVSGAKQSELFEAEPETPVVEDGRQPDVQAKEPKQEEIVVDADGGAENLRKQIEALRKSEQTQRERADYEAKARAEEAKQRVVAMQQAREREVQLAQFQHSAGESRLLAVQNAIAAAQAEADRAQTDLENAGAAGDYKALGDAQRRLARAEANLATLEAGRGQLEEEVARQKYFAQQQQQQVQRQQQQQVQQGDGLDQTNLPDTAKRWLRAHPDYLNDARKNAKIQALHWDVLDEGHAPFSDAYFEAMETHLGLRQSNMSGTNREQKQEVELEERAVPVSAPVTREVPNSSGQRASSQVRLTAGEREAAKLAGITEAEYAKQKQKLIQAKQEGLIQ